LSKDPKSRYFIKYEGNGSILSLSTQQIIISYTSSKGANEKMSIE